METHAPLHATSPAPHALSGPESIAPLLLPEPPPELPPLASPPLEPIPPSPAEHSHAANWPLPSHTCCPQLPSLQVHAIAWPGVHTGVRGPPQAAQAATRARVSKVWRSHRVPTRFF
jgi:hypothetical protein